MAIAMLLAHLIGDYVLQGDKIAYWKSKSIKGVAVHVAIVFAVTWLLSIPFTNQLLWKGVVIIGVTHLVIDAIPVLVRLPISAFARYFIDQALHMGVILGVLVMGGYLDPGSVNVANMVHNNHMLMYLLGYAFITMPAWVLIKFLTYGLVARSAPDFPAGTNKYIAIIERMLMTTFVSIGQFGLVPLLAVPRLVVDWQNVTDSSTNKTLYMVELMTSVAMAVSIGLLLREL